MNIVLVGYGRMGKEVHRVLEENGYNVVGKVERGDTFDVIKRCEVVVEFALPEATLPSLEIELPDIPHNRFGKLRNLVITYQ